MGLHFYTMKLPVGDQVSLYSQHSHRPRKDVWFFFNDTNAFTDYNRFIYNFKWPHAFLCQTAKFFGCIFLLCLGSAVLI